MTRLLRKLFKGEDSSDEQPTLEFAAVKAPIVDAYQEYIAERRRKAAAEEQARIAALPKRRYRPQGRAGDFDWFGSDYPQFP